MTVVGQASGCHGHPTETSWALGSRSRESSRRVGGWVGVVHRVSPTKGLAWTCLAYAPALSSWGRSCLHLTQLFHVPWGVMVMPSEAPKEGVEHRRGCSYERIKPRERR